MQCLQCTTQHYTTPPEIPVRMIVHMRNMKAAQAGISACGTKGGRQRPGNSLGAAEGNATRGGQECFEVGRKILMDFDDGRTPTIRPARYPWDGSLRIRLRESIFHTAAQNRTGI